MTRQVRPLPLGLLLATLLSGGLTLPGCQATSHSRASTKTQASASTAGMVYGDWKLDRIAGKPLTDPAAAHPPTLTAYDEGRAGGFAGVNRWAAPLDAKGLASGKFTLGPAATTMMAGTPEAMELERRFLDALEKARRYDPQALGDGFLTLQNDQGAELLRFVHGS
ncbi:MAG: META domain-containing protein [Phycisphaerales bacterium]|nr:META domain-containing protein [Phycisphaerales bacterium]